MSIFVAGCSHTYGDDLKNKNNAWPYKLAGLMNTDVVNVAKSGNSNDISLYETLRYTSQCKYELAVISWTYINMKTFWLSTNNHPVNFNIHLIHSLYGDELYFKEFGTLLYTYWYNRLQSTKLWLQQILLLQNWFKQQNQPYVMLNATSNHLSDYVSDDWSKFPFFHSMNDDQILEARNEILKYVELIDQNHYYGLLSFAIDQQDYDLGPTKHALEEGHEDIANKIFGFICSS